MPFRVHTPRPSEGHLSGLRPAGLAASFKPCSQDGVSNGLVELVAGVLGRAPEWVRGDLSSKDVSVRRRAEETLAAMISAALAEQTAAID